MTLCPHCGHRQDAHNAYVGCTAPSDEVRPDGEDPDACPCGVRGPALQEGTVRITVGDLPVGSSRRVWTDAVVELGGFPLADLPDRLYDPTPDRPALTADVADLDELPGVRATAHELVVPETYVELVAHAAAEIAEARERMARAYLDRGDADAADVHRPAARILRAIHRRLTEAEESNP